MADEREISKSGYHCFLHDDGTEYGSFEVFWDDQDFGYGTVARNYDSEGNPVQPGWYWWACFPGCLPDGDAIGPFETSDLAFRDARAI